MRRLMWSGIFAAVAAVTMASSANAVPSVGGAKELVQDARSASNVERVHYRKWRHSHSYQRYSRNRAYGHRLYGNNRGPGIYLNFGGTRHSDNWNGRRYRNYDRSYW
jgi:hypothetical protein